MEVFITQLLAGVQSGISVYILFCLIRYKFPRRYIYFFFATTTLFVVLKNQIIHIEPYTIIDGVAWAMYNVMIYAFIYLLIRRK